MDDGQPVGKSQGQVNEAIMEIENPTYTPNVSGLAPLYIYIYICPISLFRYQNRKARNIVLTRIDISIRKLSAPVKMDATDICTYTSRYDTAIYIYSDETHIMYT